MAAQNESHSLLHSESLKLAEAPKTTSLDGGIMSKDLHNIEFFTVISTALKTHSNCAV